MTEERKILSKCSEVTMDKFIECLCNQNYSCLIISGDFTNEEQFETWNNLFYEYCDLINSKEYQLILKYMKSVGINEAKLTAINLCLVVLSHGYNQDCVDVLKNYGYNYKFSSESLLNDLKNVQNISKGAEIKLQNDRKQLEMLTNKKKKQVKESDFDKIFIYISKYMGFVVKKKDTTVSEYCGMIQMISKK